MSIHLASLDTSTITQGNTGTISMQSAQVTAYAGSANNPAHLQFYNESGVGFRISFNIGTDQYFLPAGGWLSVPVNPGENAINWYASYVMTNQPVSQLEVLYFMPGEQVTAVGTLGNSPIGISGSVNTTSIQTLSNEGNPLGTLVIDTGPSGNAQIIEIWNDHFTLSVVQAGVVHTVLQGKTTGNQLVLGATGDTVEVASTQQNDQVVNANAGINLGGVIDAKGNAIQDSTADLHLVAKVGAADDLIQVTGGISLSSNSGINFAGGNTHLQSSGADVMWYDTTGLNLNVQGGNAFVINVPGGTVGYVFDSSGLTLKQSQGIRWINGGDSISQTHEFAGNCSSGGTVFNHGGHATPFIILPVQDVAGSQTVGINNITSTQVTITAGASQHIRALTMVG